MGLLARLRLLGWFFAVGGGAGAEAAESAASERDPWARVAILDFAEAEEAFRRAVSERPDEREARLGLAIVQLQAQPRKAETIEHALRTLDELAAEEPSDRVGITAAFMAARVVQRHREPAAPAEAAARFRRVAEAHPLHPLGQVAWVRWGVLMLYDNAGTTEPLASRFAQLEEEGRALTHPVARRDFHLFLSMAYPHLAPSDEATLRHLLAADATGLLRWQTHRDVYVRIVETALVLGRFEVAQAFRQRFEEAYPRDPRQQLLRERVEARQKERE